jgi:NAD(P)-dependent dehydrogenase (short-subunit alcohol dehydrogenase family)
MDGRVCVVTGATGGIGGATAEALARMGATVALVARSPERGAEQLQRVAAAAGEAGRGRLYIADLSMQSEVRRLAAEIAADFPRVDVLVNNAGTFSWLRRRTAEGVELQWAVNHLAPYLLTRLLLPRLLAADGGRVINVSSNAHRSGAIDPRDPTRERRRYSGLATYSATKLANILFSRELARRPDAAGLSIAAMHPGVVATEILLGSFPPLRLLRHRMRTPEQGARTVVYLAAAPEVSGRSGEYWIDEQVQAPAPAALDELLGRSLWEWSETAVGGIQG